MCTTLPSQRYNEFCEVLQMLAVSMLVSQILVCDVTTAGLQGRSGEHK